MNKSESKPVTYWHTSLYADRLWSIFLHCDMERYIFLHCDMEHYIFLHCDMECYIFLHLIWSATYSFIVLWSATYSFTWYGALHIHSLCYGVLHIPSLDKECYIRTYITYRNCFYHHLIPHLRGGGFGDGELRGQMRSNHSKLEGTHVVSLELNQ
jgi:hypothetical protein